MTQYSGVNFLVITKVSRVGLSFSLTTFLNFILGIYHFYSEPKCEDIIQVSYHPTWEIT